MLSFPRRIAQQRLALFCVCALGSVATFLPDRASAQTTAKPFTLRLDFYTYSQNPAGDVYAREVTARKPDGTTVTARTVGPVDKNMWVRIITVPGGTHVEAHDVLGLKTTYRFSSTAAMLRERLSNPPAHCLTGDSVFLRDDVVLGHPVAVVRQERGSERMTRWYAEDLGCETLGYTYEQKAADGTWKTGIVEKATSLLLGEPEPAQFVVPDSLTEAKPSETARRYDQLLGVKRTPADRQSGDMLDQGYERQQKPPQP